VGPNTASAGCCANNGDLANNKRQTREVIFLIAIPSGKTDKIAEPSYNGKFYFHACGPATTE
jgi:hypothetical protein